MGMGAWRLGGLIFLVGLGGISCQQSIDVLLWDTAGFSTEPFLPG